MKVLIVSDLHLGSSASRSYRILEDLGRISKEFDRVIFNGDTFDCFEARGVHPFTDQLLADVLQACQSRSGPPELLTGNHDPTISSDSWVYIPAAETLIFHGDCIADCTHPSKTDDQILEARLKRKWSELGERPGNFIELAGIYRKIQAQHFLENLPDLKQPGTIRYLLKSLYPPQRAFHILSYCRKAPQRAASLASTFNQPVRNVVFGHTHSAGQWHMNGMTVYNTGSFMPLSAPYAVIVDGSNVEYRKLSTLLRSSDSTELS